MKPIYLKAYNALIARLTPTDTNKGNKELLDKINTGKSVIRPAVYYIRWKLATDTPGTKPFFDNSQPRKTGETNFEKGRFPYKMEAAISHVSLSISYNAADVGLSHGRYSNFLFDPSMADISTISGVNYQVEKNRIKEDFLNSEFSFRLGSVLFYDRTPIDQFFKQGRYQNDLNSIGGVGSIENSYEMLNAISFSDNHEPEFEIHWIAGATIPNYTYAEWRMHGVEVATK